MQLLQDCFEAVSLADRPASRSVVGCEWAVLTAGHFSTGSGPRKRGLQHASGRADDFQGFVSAEGSLMVPDASEMEDLRNIG